MANDFAQVDDADVKQYDLVSATAAKNWRDTGGTVKGVQVLDYGQGDCNAIVSDAGTPIVFFDLGGGKHTGSRTHPWHDSWASTSLSNAPFRTKKLDLSLAPTVILSHWDGDHYSTGWYITHADTTGTKTVPNNHPAVTGLQWLAPRQCKHPSKLDFVKDLTSLRCWPRNVARHTFALTDDTQVVIEQCTGGSGKQYNPNLDGLAVTVQRVEGPQHDVKERILMPGDGPFKYIPSCKAGTLDKVVALLAFHHGSDTDLDDDTKKAMPAAASNQAKIAFTFGLKPGGGRCYGHPCKDAIQAYVAKGWLAANRLTPSGGFDDQHWPPDDHHTGNEANRGDVSLDFPTQGTQQQQSPTPIRSRRAALRRRNVTP